VSQVSFLTFLKYKEIKCAGSTLLTSFKEINNKKLASDGFFRIFKIPYKLTKFLIKVNRFAAAKKNKKSSMNFFFKFLKH
jgi:hypothetical protein